MKYLQSFLVFLILIVVISISFDIQTIRNQTKSQLVRTIYVVKSGDTLEEIARLYEVNLSQLRRINGLDSRRFLIYPKQTLLIPRNKEGKEGLFGKLNDKLNFYLDEWGFGEDILEPKPL